MAITTLDGALAGMQPPVEFVKAVTPTLVAGRPHSLFYLGGAPGAGSAPAPGIGGETLTSVTGRLPFTNPGAGNSYLARFQGHSNVVGTLLLCDRLWDNSGISITANTEQTFTSAVQIPARDSAGTTNGAGVYAAVEVSSATGAGTPTLTLKYTNSAGTTGRTAVNMDTTVATSAAGAFYRIGLQSGDLGIQTPNSLTLSATWTSGTIHVILYRVLARLEITALGTPNAIDALTSGFTRLYDNTCPFLVFLPATTTAANISGQFIYTQG